MLFAYIIDCMFYALTCVNGGNNAPLQSTGEPFTNRDLGVAGLGWLVVTLIIILVVRIIPFMVKAIRSKRDAQENGTDGQDSKADFYAFGKDYFLNKLLYFVECITLCYLLYEGDKRLKLKSTQEKVTAKEIATFLVFWVFMAMFITCIVFVCI